MKWRVIVGWWDQGECKLSWILKKQKHWWLDKVATQIFLEFSPRFLGEMIQIWRAYFSDGWQKNHQLWWIESFVWDAFKISMGFWFRRFRRGRKRGGSDSRKKHEGGVDSQAMSSPNMEVLFLIATVILNHFCGIFQTFEFFESKTNIPLYTP